MYRISAIYKAETGTRFDKEYYLKHHVPMAFKQLSGKIDIHRIEVEWDLEKIDWSAQDRPSKKKVISPCRFSVIVETENDLLDFFRFMKSPFRMPLHSDVKNYTDCDIVWVGSELIEPSTE